jgi:hypothetical protein
VSSLKSGPFSIGCCSFSGQADHNIKSPVVTGQCLLSENAGAAQELRPKPSRSDIESAVKPCIFSAPAGAEHREYKDGPSPGKPLVYTWGNVLWRP